MNKLNKVNEMIKKIINSNELNKIIWKLFLLINQLPINLNRGKKILDISDYNSILKGINKKLKSKKSITMLELGGGISTIIFGLRFLHSKKNALLIAIESDAEWFSYLGHLIGRYKLENNVKIYNINYKEYDNHIYFDKDKIIKILEENEKLDIVLIDAPDEKSTSNAMGHSFPLLSDKMNNDCTVYLHDKNTDKQKKIIELCESFSQNNSILNQDMV